MRSPRAGTLGPCRGSCQRVGVWDGCSCHRSSPGLGDCPSALVVRCVEVLPASPSQQAAALAGPSAPCCGPASLLRTDTVRLARSRHPTLSRVVALCLALLARHGRRRHRLSPQPALQTLPHDGRSDLLPDACRRLLTWRLQILPLSPFGGGPCRVPTLTPGTLTLVLSRAQRKTGQEQGRGSPPFTPRLTPPGGSMARGPLSLWCAGWTSRMAS